MAQGLTPPLGTTTARRVNTHPSSNPFTPPIPQPTTDPANLQACVEAIKAGVESLNGQRGDAANRAVTFRDLVNFGLATPESVQSPNPKPPGGGDGGTGIPYLPIAGGTMTGFLFQSRIGDPAQSTLSAGFGAKHWRFAVSAGDEGNAGVIDYRGIDSTALSIIGAGTATGNRLVHLFDNVVVEGRLEAHGGVVSCGVGGMVDCRCFKDNSGNAYMSGGDDAQVIMNAVAWAQAHMPSGFASIWLGAGNLIIKSPITISNASIMLVGAGKNTTIMSVYYSGNSDIISFTTCQYSGVTGVQFNIASGHTRTGGACVRLADSHNVSCEGCAWWGAFFYCIAIDGGPNQYIAYVRYCEVNPANTDPNSAGIIVGQNGFPQDVWLQDIEMGGNNQCMTGILVRSGGGIQLRNVDIIAMRGASVALLPGSGQSVYNVFADNVECDTCCLDGGVTPGSPGGIAAGFIIGSTGGFINHVTMINCWFSSHGQSSASFTFTHYAVGCLIQGLASGQDINGVHFTGCTFVRNSGEGLLIGSNASVVDVVNSKMLDNSQDTSVAAYTYSGMNITAGASHVSVVGGRSGSYDRLARDRRGREVRSTSQSQGYGYVVAAGTEYITIIGAQAFGNHTYPILNNFNGQFGNITCPVG